MPASETLALGTPVAEAGDGLWTYKPHLKTGEAETSTLLDSVQRLQKLGLQKAPDDLTVSAALLLAQAAASCSSGGAVDKIVSSLSCIAALVSAVLAAPAPPAPGPASLTAAHAAAALAAVALRNKENQQAVFQAKAISTLVPLLRAGGEADAPPNAARALMAIGSDLPGAQDEMSRNAAVPALLGMLHAKSSTAQEAARALACFAPKQGNAAVRHWIMWCKSKQLSPLRRLGRGASAGAAEPTTTAEIDATQAEYATAAAKELWLLVRYGSWLQEDMKMAAKAALGSTEMVQAWHFRLFGVYIGEAFDAPSKGGAKRAPPPPPPLPPPPLGEARRPRVGVEPELLRDAMKQMLRSKGGDAAIQANQRACLAAAFGGLLRGSEVALREEVRWEPAIHLTRADLDFLDEGTPDARAVVMTRGVRPKVRPPAEYKAPKLLAADLNVRSEAKGRLSTWQSDWHPDTDLGSAGELSGEVVTEADLDFGETPVYHDDDEKSVAVYLASGGDIDPYVELRKLVEADPVPPEMRAHTPLFRDPRTGGPISVPQLRDLVRMLMSAAGKRATAGDYGAHSLRVGGASMMVYLGADPVDVRALGRCTNECYQLYMQAYGVEARQLAAAASSVRPKAGFKHFDRVAHE